MKNTSELLITTLGTSHGDHTYCRFNSSTLFEVKDRMYLIDAGAPVEALLIRLEKQFEKLQAVFVTHMHNDHVGGLPGLIKAFVKHPKDGQYARIYLPEKEGITGLSGWLRVQHLPCPSPLYDLYATTEGKIFNDDILSVSAIPTCHISKNPDSFSSYSYAIQMAGKRIVYTGDLSSDFTDFPAIVREEPCDLCICEAQHYDMESALELLKNYPIKRLIFNHVANRWHGDGEKELIHLTNQLPYPCAIAHDGDTFSV